MEGALMAVATITRYMRWLGPATLLIILAGAACSSAAESAAVAVPTAGQAAGSASQATLPSATDDPAIIQAARHAQELTPTTDVTPTSSPPAVTATTTPVATKAPTATPDPTATATPTATPTPTLRRLTTGGCCTQPFWSPDSRQVLFIDKPDADAPTGIWGVDITQTDMAPGLVTERIAFYTDDLTYVVTHEQGETVIKRLDGPLSDNVIDQWSVPSGGRLVSISPGRTRLAWEISDDNAPPERRVTQLWVANLDGTEAQRIATLPRGGLAGWLSEDVLLITQRESLDSRVTIVYTLSLTDGATLELARAERPRGLSTSPDGRWLVYYVSLSDNADENGMWLVRTDGSGRRRLDSDLFGAYKWRDSHRLVIIPFKPQAVYHEMLELDAETGEVRRVTDPDVTPFKIANGDWQLSPDGRQVAFVESSDRNIWILTLVD
jgi:Tol biopolymer transport system component